MRGRFITFEGGEGTGKSVQASLLANRLRGLGLSVVLTREPGGSPGAEIIRHVILSGAANPFGSPARRHGAARKKPTASSANLWSSTPSCARRSVCWH